MSQLILENWFGKTLELKPRAETLLDAIHRERLDWMHLCGKKGRCITCRIRILEGMEHLSALSKAEERYRNLNTLAADERLTCQTTCLSSEATVVGCTPKATQLPHIEYGSRK